VSFYPQKEEEKERKKRALDKDSTVEGAQKRAPAKLEKGLILFLHLVSPLSSYM
jgi:hypothetical protein